MSSGLLAFVGGIGKGYIAQNERNLDRARQDRQDDRLDRQEQRQMRMDAQAKELHDYQMEEIKRTKDNRESDAAVFKPVVAQTTFEHPTQGMTPEQQQELAEKMSYGEVNGTPTYEVQGKRYTDKAASDAAIAQASTPEAQQARLVQNMRNTSRHSEANQLEATLRQGKAADMQLRAGERAEKDAKIKEANDFWNASLEESVRKHGDVYKGITEILTNSELGVAAGKKFHAVKSKDGAWVQYVATDADGKQTNFGKPYKAGPEGSMEALQDAQKVSPDMRMKYMAESLARAAAAAKAAREAEMHKADLKLKGAQGLYYSGRGAATKTGGVDAATPGASLVDRRNFISDLAGSLPDTKNASTPEEGAAILASNRLIASRADSMFETNAAFGTYLTAPQALTAMELAKDPAKHKLLRDNNTGTVYKTVSVNGKTVVIGVGEAAPKAPPAK